MLNIDADSLLSNIEYACVLPGLGVILVLWYTHSMYHKFAAGAGPAHPCSNPCDLSNGEDK